MDAWLSLSRGLLVALALLAPRVGAEDEVLRDFKKFFRQFETTPERVEAVLALEGVDSPGVVDALTPVLKDAEVEVTEACVRVLAGLSSPESVTALGQHLEDERSEAIRMGLLRAIGRGGRGELWDAVADSARDRSWEVRWRAIVALGELGRPEALDTVLAAIDDKEPAVRGAALEAAAALGSERVLEAAAAALEDESWQVRSAAIASLGTVRRTESVGLLVDRMAVEEGRLRDDLAKALERLTGRSFGARPELWQRFWEQNREHYSIPSDEELRVLLERREAVAQGYRPEAVYHGIETPSRAVLFVIDVSGSMEHEVVDKARFSDPAYPSFARMDIVKTELARTIEELGSEVHFNILAFASDTRSWRKAIAPANALNKRSAVDWVRRLEPIGGQSKQEMARVGLVMAANLEGGKTNTWAALAWALGLEDRDDYEVPIDTVFFLSDGYPTSGRYVEINDILREVREANAVRRIVFHTIAIGEFDKTFMKMLATESGGAFVDLGR